MEKRSPVPVQLRLQLPSTSRPSLEGATRKEIVQLLAQLLASAAVDGTPPTDPEASDETR